MKKSPKATVAMALNVIGLGAMVLGFISMAGMGGFEKVIFFGTTGILGCAQLLGAFLLLLNKKRMDSNTWKGLKIYWILALADIAFMGYLCNWGEEEIVPSLILGLILSIYYLYLNVRALKV